MTILMVLKEIKHKQVQQIWRRHTSGLINKTKCASHGASNTTQLEKQACVWPLLLLYLWKSGMETELVTIIHSLTMKNKWFTQLPTLVVVAQPDVIQLCKTTPQTNAACPTFGMCAGSDGPWLLLQVKWVVLQWSASHRIMLIWALVYVNYSHPFMFFKTTDCQRNQNTLFFWIIIDFFWTSDFYTICYSNFDFIF